MKNNQHKKTQLAIVLFFFFGLVFTSIVSFRGSFLDNDVILQNQSAQIKYIPLSPLPGVTDQTQDNLKDLLQKLFDIGIAVAIILSIVMTIYGGIMYMTVESMGGKKNSMKTIQGAIFGLILALSSWIILNSINQDVFSPDNTIINNKK